MNRIVFVGLLFVLGSHSFLAQARGQTRSTVTIEVAAVRINRDGQGRGSYVTTPGYVTATNYPVKMLILQAYGIADPVGFKFRLVGGPDRLLSQGVDLRAKLPEGADPQQIPSMLQALLAETFQLRIHSEVQQRPAYALRPVREGRLGPELHQSSINCVAVMASRRAEQKRTVDTPQPRDAKGRPIEDLISTDRLDLATLDLVVAAIQGCVDSAEFLEVAVDDLAQDLSIVAPCLPREFFGPRFVLRRELNRHR